MSEYKVQFEVFEGPLDLLLYLVRKQEVDIYEVNLTQIAVEFLRYIDLMREFDLDVAGEFLVMAATLMYIKSRELLPPEKQAVTEDEDEDGEDPRWELIRQLVEYKKFKDAAHRLQDRERLQEDVYPRQPAKFEFPEQPVPPPEVSLFELLEAVASVLKRAHERRRDDSRDVFEDRWTVSEKIDWLRTRIRERASFRFGELFGEATERQEIVTTFLAMLELIRLKQLRVVQSEAFGEIEVQRGWAFDAAETFHREPESGASFEPVES